MYSLVNRCTGRAQVAIPRGLRGVGDQAAVGMMIANEFCKVEEKPH
jgi:hypothetical protein